MKIERVKKTGIFTAIVRSEIFHNMTVIRSLVCSGSQADDDPIGSKNLAE